MNFDDSFDLLPGKKKHGRRASNTSSSPTSPSGSNGNVRSPPEALIRTRKTGGWADEGAKSAKTKGPNIIEQERFQTVKSQDSEDDIPIIPDIDDLQEDPLNLPDVKIPNVTVKESTYKELDNQLEVGHPNFGNLDGIDLSVLTSKLYPEKDVQKSTDIWTMESLYQDFTRQ